ncbi:delta-endotoxin CytB [Lentinula lateritia]|uniref:Delta-endotoxin CytB n=1 Tax=Lentinula aff. lateritia TaxID=2804960 RepID=A0ACC1UAT1_9AGAR|nr:delta-endotoxin CytB [Lentinula aff. lateritia]KAJ3853986.1 delta-endotoxin CytB [Lentinula lateritia]
MFNPCIDSSSSLFTATSAFQSLAKISSDLLPTELQLMKFAGHYLRLSDETQWFDWDSFLQAVLDYTGKDLPTLGRANEPIIPRDELSAVSDITDYIVYFVTQVVGVSMDASAIYDTVLNAFTNLKWASESGFADFSSSSTGTNSSWEYRITFSAPYSGSSDSFLSFVSTIYLEADITNESSWWGLVSSSKQHFHCDITGLKFQVVRGFQDPY